MKPKDKLQQAQKAFHKWRTTRKSKCDPMPLSLLDLAVEASDEVGISKVVDTLGLNHGRLSTYIKSNSIKKSKDEKNSSLRSDSDMTITNNNETTTNKPNRIAVTKILTVESTESQKGAECKPVELQSPSGWVLRFPTDSEYSRSICTSTIKHILASGGEL